MAQSKYNSTDRTKDIEKSIASIARVVHSTLLKGDSKAQDRQWSELDTLRIMNARQALYYAMRELEATRKTANSVEALEIAENHAEALSAMLGLSDGCTECEEHRKAEQKARDKRQAELDAGYDRNQYQYQGDASTEPGDQAIDPGFQAMMDTLAPEAK